MTAFVGRIRNGRPADRTFARSWWSVALFLVSAAAVGVVLPTMLAMPAEHSLRLLVVPIAVADAALLWIAWRSRTPTARMGASFLVPAVLPVIGIAGYWWYLTGRPAVVMSQQPGGVVGSARIEPDQYLGTLALFLAASCLFLVGSRCWRGDLGRTASVQTDLSEGLAPLRLLIARYSGVLLVLAGIPAVILVVGYGPLRLIERSAYRDGTDFLFLLKIGSSVSLAAAVTAATLYALPIARSRQQLAVAIFAAYAIFNYGMTTRELALAPAAWMLGHILGKGRFPKVRSFVVVGVLTLMLYSVPLTHRALPRVDGNHGLVPYVLYDVRHPDIYFDVDLELGMRNIFQTFGVGGYVAFNADPIETRYFFANINPLPAGLSGWNEVSQDNKITRYAPYSAIGELANHGPLAFAGTILLLGALLGAIDRIARSVRFSAGLLIRVASSGVGGLLVFQFIQYHLRTTARLAEVAIVGALVIATFDRSQRRHFGRTAPVASRWGVAAGIPGTDASTSTQERPIETGVRRPHSSMEARVSPSRTQRSALGS